MKLPGGWRWRVAAAVVALGVLFLLWNMARETPPQEPVVARKPTQGPDSRADAARERPTRERGTRP
ncbi:MAG: hypothetical protein ACT4PS_05775 [Betaproteobacteria bacterium]